MNLFNYFKRSTDDITDESAATVTEGQNVEQLVKVGMTNAENLSWVRFCVSLRADTLSTLPLKLFRKDAAGYQQEAGDHPVSALLETPYAGNEMTLVDLLNYGQLCYDLRGNAYYKIVRGSNGIPEELLPLDASKVTPSRIGGKLVYNVDGNYIAAKDVIHVRNNASNDGIEGKGPIQVCREEVFNSTSELIQTLRVYQNNVIQSRDFITFPTGLTEKQLAQALQRIAKRKTGQPFFLLNGAEHSNNAASLSAEDAQFIQTMQFNASRIAALFNVPAYKLNLTSDRKPASSAEQENMEWATTLQTLCIKWEKELAAKLLTAEERRTMYFKFNLNAMLRADIKTRSDHYDKMLKWGVYSRNDVRRLEDLPPIPAEQGGDDYLKPVNMAVADSSTNTDENGKS